MNNMQENDTILVQDLIVSFTRQLALYKELRDTVRSVMSKLILSRGDTAGLMSGIEKKQKLMEAIGLERESSAEKVALWQERRDLYDTNKEIGYFNEILTQTQKVIKEFLESEDQLKRYLEKMYKKSGEA